MRTSPAAPPGPPDAHVVRDAVRTPAIFAVIFDPATGDMISTREVAVTAEPRIAAGTVLDSNSQTVMIVDRIPARAPHGHA